MLTAELRTRRDQRTLVGYRSFPDQHMEAAMRWLILMVTIFGLCGIAQAHEPLARPMKRTPSIMVGGEAAAPPRTVKRRHSAKLHPTRTRRTQAARNRSFPVPSANAVYEGSVRSIDSSIRQQQQLLQLQQQRQVDHNLLRLEIQRRNNLILRRPYLGCSPGLFRC
jgi:hypothetical protein